MPAKGRGSWKAIVPLAAVTVVAVGLLLYLLDPSQGEAGGIEGTVTDRDGKPVAGMRLSIVSGTTGFPEIAVETDGEGHYRIGGVPPGTFEVAVHDKQGNRVGLESVAVRSGETSTLNFTISPTP